MRGVHIAAEGVSCRRGDSLVVDTVSFEVAPGELVAVIGASGAGKTTLLETLATIRRPDDGVVRFDGADAGADPGAVRRALGYVPQDDIIHAELPLARTLRYAAWLRLPRAAGSVEVDAAVQRVLHELGLDERAQVVVGSLSGGQRKRASIAVELLTRPDVILLDEPTSGLDPATAADLLRVLRDLTTTGTTVVFTTHALQDLEGCDRVLCLARGGRLAYDGPPDSLAAHFGVTRQQEIYTRLATAPPEPVGVATGGGAPAAPDAPREAVVSSAPAGPAPDEAHRAAAVATAGPGRQWAVATLRTAETLARNRLTMAILAGAPVMIVAMFAILFRPGAFDPAAPDPTTILMIVFWVTFGAFFFGLTYGLLQVVTEQAIVRREHLAGLGLAPYLLAKVAVLVPFLAAVVVLMLGVLRLLDRLPAAGTGTYLSIGATLLLVAVAGLALGLLTSAAVDNAAQATLALPMLCFPAVLFSGAILPVHVMATVGKVMSVMVPTRWAFESIGRDLGVRELLLAGGSPLGPPLVASYGDAGTLATGTYALILGGFVLALFVGAWATLRRACRTDR